MLTAGHDRALGLVYGAALGGWSYLVGWGILLAFDLSDAQAAGALIGLVAGLAVMWDVERIGRVVNGGGAEADAEAEREPLAARLP